MKRFRNNKTSSWQQFGAANVVDFVVYTGPAVYVPGVSGLYHFEDALDSSMYLRDLTASGATYSAGKLGDAGDTQTSGSWTATSTAMDLSGDFTIGYWLYANYDPPTVNAMQVMKRNTAPEYFEGGPTYATTCAPGTWEFMDQGACSSVTAPSSPSSTWVSLIVTRSGTTLEFYENNELVGSTSDTQTGNFTQPVHMNGDHNGTYKTDFLIDELFFANQAISASARDALWNNGMGAEVCVTEGCGGLGLLALHQYKTDATTTIASGDITTESTVIFGAQLNSSDTSTVQLQVEIQPAGTGFTGTPNATSGFVSPGSFTTTTFKDSSADDPSVYPRDPEAWSDGNFHWQARVKDSNGATSTWQLFGVWSSSTDFTVNTVPLYMQSYGPWPSYSNATDTGTGWWHDQTYFDGNTTCGGGSTIGYCGCAISTVTMWLRYYGILLDGDGNDVNPGRLNTWLTNHGGYDPSGNLQWGRITAYASSTGGGVIIYDSTSSIAGTYQELKPNIDTLLSSSTPDPVILYEAQNEHFVLATGFAQHNGTSTYTVRDSAYYNTLYLNQTHNTSSKIYGYGNELSGIRIFYDPPRAPDLIEYHTNLPNTLILVDSEGKRAGKDPATGIIYREIEGVSYNEDGISPSNRVSEIYVSGAKDGEYTMYVLGGESGTYWISVNTDDWSHGYLGNRVLRGDILRGSVVGYEQQYNRANIASSTLVYKVTHSSTMSIASEPPHNLPFPIIPRPMVPSSSSVFVPTTPPTTTSSTPMSTSTVTDSTSSTP